MKPIYVFAVVAAVVGMTGNLWADAASGLSTGKRQHEPFQKARKKLPGKMTAHDKSQVSGNLNGGTKGNQTYSKNAWPNGKQGNATNAVGGAGGKNGLGDGSKGGTIKPDAYDTFSKTQSFQKTNSTIGSATGGAGSGKAQ